jgi:hypothetical protein
MNRAEAAAILGVSPNASMSDAKKAYLSRARLLHPDRFAGAAPEDVAAATTAMAQLNEAWTVLQQSPSTSDERPPSPSTSSSSSSEERESSGANGGPSGPTEWSDPSTACALCGWGPAAPVKFNSVTGLVLFWRWGTLTGPLCRLCGEAMYNESQRSTLLKGWWGVVAPLATVVAFVGNALKIGKIRALPNPVARYPGAFTALPAPIPVSVHWYKRPASIVASLTALAIIGFIVAGIATAPVGNSSSAGVGTCWAEDPSDPDYLDEVDCDSSTAQFQVSRLVADGNSCTDAYIELGNGQVGCLNPLPEEAAQSQEAPTASASAPGEPTPAVEESGGVPVADVCTKRSDEGEECSSFYDLEPGTGYYGACFADDATLRIQKRVGGTWQLIASHKPYRTEDCSEDYPYGADATWIEPVPGLFDARVVADGDVVDEFQLSALADDSEYETCYSVDFGEGDKAEDCFEGRAWVLEFCSIDGKSSVQRIFRDEWTKYGERESQRDLSACDADYPYLVTVSAFPEFAPGVYKYRIREADGSNTPFKVTVTGPRE